MHILIENGKTYLVIKELGIKMEIQAQYETDKK